MFTLIGAGVTTLDNSERLMKDVLPKPCVLHQTKVTEFDPDANQITLATDAVVIVL